MGSPRAILAVAVIAACTAAFVFLRGRGDGPDEGTGRSEGSGPRGPLAVEGAPPPLAAGPRVLKDATDEVAETPAPTSAEPATPEELDPADRPAWWPGTATDGHRAVRLRVRCVNAVTGETVAARWRLTDALWVAVSSVPWLDSRWRGGDLYATVFLEPDASIGRRLEIATPAGFLPPTEERIKQPVASDADEVMIIVPLWPAFDLELTLRGPDGAPARGARLFDFRIAETRLDVFGGDPGRDTNPSDAEGIARVWRLPFVPGADLRARVLWRSELVGGTAEADVLDTTDELSDAERARPPVVVRLPAAVTTTLSADARVAGPTDGATGAGSSGPGAPGNRGGFGIEVFAEPETSDRSTLGRVRVRVRGADGRPVARASVRSRRSVGATDTEGVVELAGLVAGVREIGVSVPGGFHWRTNVVVAAGAVVDVALVEPAAGQVDVEVVDEEGRACPFARVHIDGSSGSATYDVEDGVQRLDALTDATGRRSFRRVAPGEASLVAWWRGREGRAQVVVEERGRVTARVVVR